LKPAGAAEQGDRVVVFGVASLDPAVADGKAIIHENSD
jgi:hypothetical protein